MKFEKDMSQKTSFQKCAMIKWKWIMDKFDLSSDHPMSTKCFRKESAPSQYFPVLNPCNGPIRLVIPDQYSSKYPLLKSSTVLN